MTTSKTNSKVYIDIVHQLRNMIQVGNMQPGDKIPSERELSERLNVGRSSVREALRALELLGLIETKRGEGTFLKDFSEHQFIELLSTFILQDNKVKNDIRETKFLIEMDSLRLICHNKDDKQVELKELLEELDFDDNRFFRQIVELSDNHLLFRIWIIINEYYKILYLDKIENSKNDYITLVHYLLEREEEKVINHYQKNIRKMSNR